MGPTVEPLYKGQVGDGPYSGASLQGTSWGWALQWSLSTRDKLGMGPTVEPLYKGQVGDWSYSGASLQGTSWGWALQWSLSTRDKLGMGPTVEPLYKGQVGDGYSGASLQGTSWLSKLVLHTYVYMWHFTDRKRTEVLVTTCTPLIKQQGGTCLEIQDSRLKLPYCLIREILLVQVKAKSIQETCF